MEYKKKDVVIGFIIILLILFGLYTYRKIKTPKPLNTDTNNGISFIEELKDSFNYEIADDVKTIRLEDVSGGDGRGIATENEILADLSDPETGYYYQVWLEKNGEYISLGKMGIVKGGWLSKYDKSSYEGYNNVVVSLEKVVDNKIETKILEGSF
ncbi:MAG: hypothetical protein QY322_03445 [bacterium]|nr:MAG: hypothetical protein QY322_03445 [bacterium]